MSSTERIAVALLGWRKGNSREIDFDVHEMYRSNTGQLYLGSKTGSPWPILTTLDGCRLFEDVLRKRFMLQSWKRIGYVSALTKEFVKTDIAGYDGEALLFATPAQRVAACIRVLDEAGL